MNRRKVARVLVYGGTAKGCTPAHVRGTLQRLRGQYKRVEVLAVGLAMRGCNRPAALWATEQQVPFKLLRVELARHGIQDRRVLRFVQAAAFAVEFEDALEQALSAFPVRAWCEELGVPVYAA